MQTNLIKIATAFLFLLTWSGIARAADPVAITSNVTVSTVGASLIQLQGSDADGTPLHFDFTSAPLHGTVSDFNHTTGYFVYTPTPGYTGTDGIFFVVSSGGQTSNPGAIVSLVITNAKTRIVDTLVDAGGNPRQGRVTFILTRPVTSPAGITPAGATVSATVNASGVFDIQVYPSRSLNPQTFYQVWYEASNSANRQLIGIYDIPASATTSTLAGWRVTDTNLAAQYVFVSNAGLNQLIQNVAARTLESLIGPLANLTVAGSVTATSFIGNGASLTGITGATGGVANAGSTTVGADTDANGSGVISLQTANVDRLTISNAGIVNVTSELQENGARVLTTGSIGNLSVAQYASLPAAVTAIGATPSTLIVPASLTLSADLTIPSTTTVAMGGAAIITVNSTKTLTISGALLDPGVRQIFGGAGTVELSNRVPLVRPEWWGLNTATAIQSAVNALPSTGGEVFLSTSYTSQIAPIWIDDDYVRLTAKDSYQGTATTISGTVRGPLVLIGRPAASPTFATSLATGSGVAISIAAPTQRVLNLGDGGSTNLDGKTALTVSGFFKWSSLGGVFPNGEYITSSFGRRLYSETPTLGYAIRSYADGSIDGLITTKNAGATTYTVTAAAGTISTGTTYHVELSYDGTTLRLFVDGVLKDSIAATGVIKQPVAEDVTIGAPPLDWPDAGAYFATPSFLADGIEIARIARHTSAFATPTAKPTADADTLIVLNFDNNSFPFIVADGPAGVDIYLLYRAAVDGAYTSYTEVSNLTLLSGSGGGSGIFTYNAPNMRLRDLTLTGRMGMQLLGQNFISRFENLHISTDNSAARVGALFGGAPSASSSVDGINVQGFPYGIVALNGPPRFQNSFVNTYSDSIIPIVFKNQPPGLQEVTFNGLWLDDETAAGAGVTREAGIALSAVYSFTFNGGFLWMSQNPVPLFLIDSPGLGSSGKVEGSRILISPSATEVFKFQGTAPANPIRILGAQKYTDGATLSTVPWSTTMEYLEIDGVGLPVAPAQITANQNNYNPGRKARAIRLTTDASRNVTGLVFTSPMIGGEEHEIINTGSFNLVLKHQDTNSTAANRFLSTTAADITLTPDQSARLIYDSAAGRWRVSPPAVTLAGLGLATTDTPTFNTSAVIVEGKLSTTAGVNLNTTSPTTLFTCPSGKTCVVTRAIVRNTSASLVASGSVIRLKANSVIWSSMTLYTTHLNGSSVIQWIHPGQNNTIMDAAFHPNILAATQTFTVDMDVAFGSAATVTIDVFGYLF